jgi:ribosomal protein L13E
LTTDKFKTHFQHVTKKVRSGLAALTFTKHILNWLAIMPTNVVRQPDSINTYRVSHKTWDYKNESHVFWDTLYVRWYYYTYQTY